MDEEKIIEWLEKLKNKGGIDGTYAFHAIELIEDKNAVDHALSVLTENGWKIERIIREG